MTPRLTNGEVAHNPGPIALGVFKDIGWSLATDLSMKKMFVPLVMENHTLGIYGLVTDRGKPAANVQVALRRYDGKTVATIATDTTDASGLYSFTGAPTLTAGQEYYVWYSNAENNPNRLISWVTPSLESYSTGKAAQGGSFDIANVALIAPAQAGSTGLPATFTWTPRPASKTDSYELHIYHQNAANQRDLWWWSNPFGYKGSFTLPALPVSKSPPGIPFQAGVQVYWDLWVHAPDGGVGFSRAAHRFSFTASAAGSSDEAFLEAIEAHEEMLLLSR
jgi:hypothetical protein